MTDAQPALVLAGVERRFGAVAALAGVDLAVRAGELLTILGPSGSGKTTLLKLVAGFELPDRGELKLGGRTITFLAPARRNIGMVFQNYALFPHMSVARNIAFPLEMRGAAKDEIRDKVGWALEMVGLMGYEARLPRELSGGQQQRVALARAIVFGPGLLLLDEPFGALDRKLREQMQLEVKRLQRRLGITTLFVTHDQDEALMLSDRIAVMNEGRIEQVAPPREIYGRPANRFVADFVGESNLFRGRAGPIADGVAQVKLDIGATLRVAMPDPAPGVDLGLILRPDRPRILVPGEHADNRFAGRIAEETYLGEAVRIRVALDIGAEILLRRPAGAPVPPGGRVEIGWSAADMHALPWT